ncbi:hypothetical protein GCM10022223_32530 [Kineosporia mesophila]|uniref:Integrase catalytic domain-containing protein n=1 Tax=Kineosporia mesophila TaxID=566012 RepID=A0ABP6ZMV9_9ACTN|nr:hypothetical protein [Kineosporia mesophila]MCD5354422.1 hypothetical protein [Kineosporia mesophila]
MFLCAIRDGHSRRVLGYAIDDHVDAPMVARTIDAAVATRLEQGQVVAGIILTWIRWFNHERRHPGAEGLSSIRYEQTLTSTAHAA